MTFIGIQKERIESLKAELTILLSSSRIEYTSYPGIFSISGDHTVTVDTDPVKQLLQSKLFKEFVSIDKILGLLINQESKNIQKEYHDSLVFTREVLENKEFDTWDKNMEEVKEHIDKDLDKIINLLSLVYTEKADEIVIPDTSYILNNTNFTIWLPKSGKVLTIVIPAIVLHEIDEKKEFHRDPVIKEKAQTIAKIIRNVLTRNADSEIKTIVKEKVFMILEPTEPKRSNVPQDLDLSVPDDRFIASAIEIIKKYSNSECYIASDDINQINKAICFGIPVL